jgi:hypothetical protein
MYEESNAYGWISTPDPEINLTQMQSQLIELLKRSERQRIYLPLYTCALVLMACIAIGLSLYLFLRTTG